MMAMEESKLIEWGKRIGTRVRVFYAMGGGRWYEGVIEGTRDKYWLELRTRPDEATETSFSSGVKSLKRTRIGQIYEVTD